jgi:signal transduction histidine kinase
MALFGVSALILLGFIYWSTTTYMARQTDATIEAEIGGLADRYRISGLAGLTTLIAERLSRKPAGSSVYLLADDAYAPLVGNIDRWPAVRKTTDGWLDFRLEEHAQNNGAVHRARAQAFRLEGGFHLLVGRDLYELEETQAVIARTLVWGLLVTVVLGGIGGVMMSRSMARRIEAINEASREIMSGDLSRRIPTRNSGDDFDVLVGNLNDMLDQIESLMEGVRRVSDNIAHDLRTPLARLRNHLELLRLQAGKGGRDREVIEQAVADADGLLSTFNALLRIARVESEHRREAFTEVDLGALVGDVAELYEPLAEEKGQAIAMQRMAGVRVRGDRDLLFQAIANLLDNAIKYTPEGGRIEIRLGPDRLEIMDTGPGIPAEAREKVFQRFFRLDESRTTPGNGLGLSLVAAVARLHGIAVCLEDNRPGLRVVLDISRRGAIDERSPPRVP